MSVDEEERRYKKYEKTNKYSEEQLMYIRLAINAGFSDDALLVLANPKLSPNQMEQIYLGFLSGLSLSEVKLFAKASLSLFQMIEARFAFKNNLTYSQVKRITTGEYPANIMKQLRLAYEENLKPEFMDILLTRKINETHMKLVRSAAKFNIRIDELEYFLSNHYVLEQLEEIILAMERRLRSEEIHYIARPENTYLKMRFLRECFEAGLRVDDVKRFDCDGFKLPQLKELAAFMLESNDKDKFHILFDVNLSHKKMNILREYFNRGLEAEDLRTIRLGNIPDKSFEKELKILYHAKQYEKDSDTEPLSSILDNAKVRRTEPLSNECISKEVPCLL